MTINRLNQAIQLIKDGKKVQARDLILDVIKSDPKNMNAWLWALEVASNNKEKRVILHKILEIDPNHKAALSYLRSLDLKAPEPATSDHQFQDKAIISKPSGFSGFAKLLFDWIASLPSGCFFIAIFVAIVGSLFIYTRVNTGLFGAVGTELDDLVISKSYELISSEEFYWDIQFEGIGESKYIGTVRHAAPIRIQEFAILTHDVLVTTGDFANPDIVNTNVIDHKFFWKSPGKSSPSGSINLIHAVPANKAIYQQLLEIQKWDTVKITGREIFTIRSYKVDETFLGTWLDTGCNTLLVESVTIIKGTEEN
jgi:hypothetical protein